MKGGPYMSSKKARTTGPWYDCFAKGGAVAWLVFDGYDLLAEVKNEQQAINVIEAIKERQLLLDLGYQPTSNVTTPPGDE